MISVFKLVSRSLIHYWKAHLLVCLGAAVSTMVLTGTLIVGDSVDTSLRETAEYRLGRTSYSFSGIDRYFRQAIAAELAGHLKTDVAAVLQLNGIASSQGGKFRVNSTNILGVDETFGKLSGSDAYQTSPGKNEAFISANLSNRLQLQPGDPFLLRLEKVSAIPKNAPFVSDEDNFVSLRLTVAKVLSQEQLGRFNLKASQTAPFNIFLGIDYLNENLDLKEKANILLFADNSNLDESKIRRAIDQYWRPRDLGLDIIPVNQESQWEIRSERVFIESNVIEAVKKIEPDPEVILTYFANSIEHEERETPYSFIAAGPYNDNSIESAPGEILINQWLANDLHAVKGDSIEISYYAIGPLRRLEERKQWFRVSDIVELKGQYADLELMPTLPGLTDAGSCSEWETGIPIDLERIRDKDEDYWNEWKGIPKGFISYEKGKELWENRFGECTAIRLPASKYEKSTIETELASLLDPLDFGFAIEAVKEKGLQAASGGVDFSQLFMGMSFFLLIAGFTLMILLFNLHLEKRLPQTGTLKALGYSTRLIQKLILLEGLLVALIGVILGGYLGILYNKLIFNALNTVWNEIVRTSVLREDVRLDTVIIGMLVSLLLAYLVIWFNVRRKLKDKPASLQRGLLSSKQQKVRWLYVAGWTFLIIAIALLAYQGFIDDSLNTGIFFMSGGLILIALLLLVHDFLNHQSTLRKSEFSLVSLSAQNIRRNRARSLRIIILFALGTFLVVSTGLNRKDLYSGADDKQSGTGGYLFYGEATLPILSDLNIEENRLKYGIELPLSFVQMRKSAGDDASCLNLNRITQPRILALSSEALDGRFSFVKKTAELDEKQPWKSLDEKLPGDVIPAIADQTVIQWGLGKKVGDTLIYNDEQGRAMKLKLIGGLANSIFQGNVLIDESHFLEHFPSNSGTHILLIDGDRNEKAQTREELARVFRNYGLDLTDAADRLASFNEVENTYLSIFLILGGLGMILGAVGLGISLARNMLDRRQELAILKAMGYKIGSILKMLTLEHMILLGAGTFIGALTAFIATIPSVLSQSLEASWPTALGVIVLIMANGLFWTIVIARGNLRTPLLESLRTE